MRVGVPDLGTGGPKAPRTARHKADEQGPAKAGTKKRRITVDGRFVRLDSGTPIPVADFAATAQR